MSKTTIFSKSHDFDDSEIAKGTISKLSNAVSELQKASDRYIKNPNSNKIKTIYKNKIKNVINEANKLLENLEK